MEFSSGVLFFHRSFLIEVSDTWLSQDKISKSGELFMKIVFSSIGCNEMIACDRTLNNLKELITCDRTTKELSKPKYTLKAVQGVFDLIEERSLPDGNENLDDEYSFKVACFKKISPMKVYFIVSDDKKSELQEKAKKLNYTLEIVSTSDLDK
jgi:hypothetical protein